MTHRGITYVQNGTGTTTMNLDLQLQGGVDQDETGWLSGAGAAAGGHRIRARPPTQRDVWRVH